MLFRDSAYPCHAAIVGVRDSKLTIIHAHASRRKVVEEPIDQADWISRAVAAFEFPLGEE